MTPAQRWLGRVAAIGCVACMILGSNDVAAEVHHIREGRQARDDFLVLPLCREHHQGTRASVHHRKSVLMRALGVQSEFDLLAMVLAMLEAERANK